MEFPEATTIEMKIINVLETVWLRADDGVQLLVDKSSGMSWVFVGCSTGAEPIQHI